MENSPFQDTWHYQYPVPMLSGQIRTTPSDFRVTEVLGFELTPGDRHLWLEIRKEMINTAEVASMLARAVGVKAMDVGYSGLKDRNAICHQWFSVPIDMGNDQILDKLTVACESHPQVSVLQSIKCQSKLKRGTHRLNQFEIVVRKLSGDGGGLGEVLENIKQKGVPNYFGEQRFGRNRNNLYTATKLFSQKNLKLDRVARSMALSAARSYLFNLVLSERIKTGWYDHVRDGDVMQLEGSNSWFKHDGSDTSVIARMQEQDVHITGPLWGVGESPCGETVAKFEQTAIENYPLLVQGLVRYGLKNQRRALRMIPLDLDWEISDNTLQIRFSLRRGQFATSVIRELVQLIE